MKAFPSASLCAPFSRTASCAASNLTSAGREGVYRAVHAAHRSEKLHIVVHDITEGNIKMVKNGTVDFIIGQDVKTQGTLPIRLLYDYLERHQFPRERMNMTDITIKFRGNV